VVGFYFHDDDDTIIINLVADVLKMLLAMKMTVNFNPIILSRIRVSIMEWNGMLANAGEKCIMRSFITCKPHQILLG
jgi:hypothetical protein